MKYDIKAKLSCKTFAHSELCHTAVTGQTGRQAGIRKACLSEGETLARLQPRIKPQLASVSLLFGLFGKGTKRGMNSLAEPLRELQGQQVIPGDFMFTLHS